MTDKELRRSRTDRMVAGVAGGLGEYLGVDPTIVRLVFVVLFFVSAGTAAVAYLVMWLVAPEEGSSETEWKRLTGAAPAQPAEPAPPPGPAPPTPPAARRRRGPAIVLGLLLVAVGALSLAARIAPWDLWRLWPLAIVLAGVWMLASSLGGRR